MLSKLWVICHRKLLLVHVDEINIDWSVVKIDALGEEIGEKEQAH